MSTPQAARGGGFRTDIEAMRAVAILLVVAFHIGAPRFQGGYIGVDVFFVLSGFLITTQIVADRRGDTFGFRKFWARRVRRLVPALALMVGVIVLAAAVLLPAIYLDRILREGLASVLYVSNIVFARDASNYFRSTPSPDLFRHTWSLGVEEQFYLVWPLFIAAAWVLAHRLRPQRPVIVLATVLGLMGVGSFAVAVVLTNEESPWSFYGLPTRAWEFAIGGLLAVTGWRLRRLSSVVTLVGLAVIVVAAMTFNGRTPHPGWSTLVPTIATAAVIAACCSDRSITGRALAMWPLQHLGRLSYSWYLWHWPLIVLGLEVVSLSYRVRVAGALIGLGLAVVTNRVVEQPIRFSPRLQRSIARTFAVGGAATAMALVAIFVVGRYEQREMDDPLNAKLARALTEKEDVQGELCRPRTSSSGIDYCEVGAEDGPTVVLLGDSHAIHWTPAADAAGRAEGITVAMHTMGGCPSLDVPLEGFQGTIADHCAAFHEATTTLLHDLHPTAVVHSNLAAADNLMASPGVDSPDEATAVWVSAVERAAQEAEAVDAAFGIILDNPHPWFDPIECLAEGGSSSTCSPTLAEALREVARTRAAEAGVVDRLGRGALLDTLPLVCRGDSCPVIIDDEIVYNDTRHIAAGFSRRLAPEFGQFLQALVHA